MKKHLRGDQYIGLTVTTIILMVLLSVGAKANAAWPYPDEVSVAGAYNTVFLTEVVGTPYDTASIDGLNALVADHGGTMQTTWNPVTDNINSLTVLVFDTANIVTFGIKVGSTLIPIYTPGPWTPPSRGWINNPMGAIGSGWSAGVVKIEDLLLLNGLPTNSDFSFYVGSVELNSSNTHRIDSNGTNGGFFLAYNEGGLAANDMDSNEPIIYVNPPSTAPGGCNGLRPTIVGTPNRDVIKGTADADVIMSLDGNDVVYGYGGNDVLCTGDGNDVVYGGDGDDTIVDTTGLNRLFGEDGNDVIIGGNEHDVIDGGYGNDIIYGGDGDDTLMGNLGDDVLYGEGGNDTMTGNSGNDILNGGYGDDVITGDTGDDILNGDAGNDKLVGDSGNDILNGGDGDDMLYGYGGYDTLDGGNGTDTCDGGGGAVGSNTAVNCETETRL
jgi:Ca2+-binding RTX toxin-like protein